MKRSHNDVDYSTRTASPRPDTPDNVEDADIEPWMGEAERMTRALQRGMGKYWAFLTEPEQRAEYVRGLALELSKATHPDGSLRGDAPRRQQASKAQIQNKPGDSEFLDDPERWNKSTKL